MELKTCDNCNQLKYIKTDFDSSNDAICKSCKTQLAKIYVNKSDTIKIDSKQIDIDFDKPVKKSVDNSTKKIKKTK